MAKPIPLLLILGILTLQPGYGAGGEDPIISRHIQWLESMVREGHSDGKKFLLIQSYSAIPDRCWIYDQALSVMVFSAAGKNGMARRILQSLEHLQNPDGSFYFSYHIPDLTPTSRRKYTGSVAWVLMAVNLYRILTGDPSFRETGLRMLGWLKAQQVLKPDDPRHGGLSLGVRDDAFSTEHNLDAFSAFRHSRGIQSRKRARLVRRFIMRELYSSAEQRFLTGFEDYSRYLDCQSWAILNFGRRYRFLLGYIQDHFLVLDGSLAEEEKIEGFFERETGHGAVWSEGTLGVAMAMRVGRRYRMAANYYRQVLRMMDSTGGIAYATRNHHGFSTSSSVAGTAWAVFYKLGINPFRPRGKSRRNTRRYLRRAAGGGRSVPETD